MHTIEPAFGHEACFVCREKFCFSSVGNLKNGVETDMTFALKHEGWEGIPHGGVAMTALLDLADHCWLKEKGKNLVYPLTAEWRFADAVAIGDKMHLRAEVKEGETITASMQSEKSVKTYLRAEIKLQREIATSYLSLPDPQDLLQNSAAHQALAVYDNCFVCGRKRQFPGLQRRFFKTRIDADESSAGGCPAIIVRFGGAGAAAGLAASFQQAPDQLHPGVLAALLDELCGWSGVLADDLYGFTVRFKLNINRLPRLDEEIFGFAPTPEVKGRGERQFYFPEGCLYQKNSHGAFEVIATATGQWLARHQLRRQFDDSHIEEDLTGIAF